MKFNTAIASLMALMNDIQEVGSVTKEELRVFCQLLNVFAPHIAEEVWERQTLGSGMVCQQPWPAYDESKCVEATIEIVVQINGKVRARLQIPAELDAAGAIAAAKAQEKIAADLAGKTIVKELYVPGKLVNLVAK